MFKNAKMIRWLIPACLLILLSILLLVLNYTAYTAPARPLDLNTVATAVSNVNKTATSQALHKKPQQVKPPIEVATPTPRRTAPTPTMTPKETQ